MNWVVEWTEYNPETEEIAISSDSWNKWDDVVRIFNDCIKDELCYGAAVYCYRNDEPYPSAGDNLVLAYCP